MKLIAIQLDDATYTRLEQLALAKGMTISDYARSRLDIELLQKETNEEYERRVHDVTVNKMRKDAEKERGSLYRYDVKVYKSVGKRIRIYWRTRALTDYDAMMSGHPAEAGKWELKIQRETEHPRGGPDPRDHVEGDWYKEGSESKFYWKRRGLYKAINSLLAHYGKPALYREGPHNQPDQPHDVEVADEDDNAP